MYCDLHNHSNFSDGTDTPEELIARAEELGLAAIGLTDHNTVSGLPRFLAAAEGTGVEPLPGVEFSTEHQGDDLHILALFVRPEHYDAISDLLEQPHRRKRESNLSLADALTRAGYPIDYPALERAIPGGHVNRAHFAGELVRLGYADDAPDAFSRFLKVRCGYYTPPKKLDALETIAFIRKLGAVSVLAHPWLNLKTREKLESFLTQAVPLGLDSMEVRYSKFTPEQTAVAEELSAVYGILPSGGSDYHGEAVKPGIAMGTGRGDLRVPYEWFEALKNLSNQRLEA